MDGSLRKSIQSLAALLVSLTIFSGCSTNNPEVAKDQPSASVPAELQNASTEKAMKVVSLAPSNTELLLDSGASDSLIGVCSNCAEVLPNGKERLKDKPVTGTFTSVNLERITRLKPDIVLVVSGQEAIASLLRKHGFKVVLLDNTKLSDISLNLQKIEQLHLQHSHAEKLSAEFEEATKGLNKIISTAKSKPKIFYCIWPQPLLTIGSTSFLNDCLTICGGTNIAANLTQPYPHYSAERLILADPDIVVLPYEAKDQPLFKRFPWNKLRAVKDNRLYYLPAPKDDMLARPTMGVLDGLYWLSTKVHPELTTELTNWHDQVKSFSKDPSSR